MESLKLIRLQPTLPVIAEMFDALGWQYQAVFADERQSYCGLQIYSGQDCLEADILYIVTDEYSNSFPADTYSYLSQASIPGKSNHICSLHKTVTQLLEKLLFLFQQFQEQEKELDRIVLSDGSLDDLCNWGRALTGNPICIHDGWFIITAMSDDFPQVLPPESVAASVKQFIPQKFINSFKFDMDYLNSYTHKEARLWLSEHQPEYNRSIYANLWDEDVCQGRVLVVEEYQQFQASDFLIAECLAQRAVLILRRRGNTGQWGYRSMDDTVYELLTGQAIHRADVSLLLDRLAWKRTDQYLCVRLQNQLPDTVAIFGNLLHNDLFHLFPDSYIMYVEHQQCMIQNLSKDRVSISQVRHSLAPLCRDYCLYAGISSPVWGIEELNYAFLQADIALKKAFDLQNDQWVIPFSSCALDYMLQNIQTELLPGQLIAPELLALMDHDEKKGTQYFATLSAFLQNERDIPKTSKALIIHRTTLIYRLKRIQTLTGLNLDDPDQRLYLQLSLKLLEYRDFGAADNFLQ